ncbi:MAG: hypothetical protein JO219_08400 [Candidatus Eremiobacteraeota bacterium]|nr:hypothetical protein [Candidatus Eremiobacteraeota bacterium]MBV8366796.1 hypothetical protein [Candidatus Eremiobacteraeota bacterium]
MDSKKNDYVPHDEEDQENVLLEGRSTLVRVRRGPDTSIFSGWGPKL